MRYVHERVGGTATLARSNVHLRANALADQRLHAFHLGYEKEFQL
jgi:hypothetical protein